MNALCFASYIVFPSLVFIGSNIILAKFSNGFLPKSTETKSPPCFENEAVSWDTGILAEICGDNKPNSARSHCVPTFTGSKKLC